MGRLDRAPSLNELSAQCGDIARSRIAAVAKEKHGQTKVRLVHDLRRSGVNERVVVRERVVLPRATEVVGDALDLLEATGETEAEFFVLDFKDAFKQLTVDPSERRFLGGEALEGFFVYKVLVFGIKSGPLLWGRVAALLMRLTAAALYREHVRIQCFVDDPVATLAGTPVRRRLNIWKMVVRWRALGFALSWKKGQRGPPIDWIGARFGPWHTPSGRHGVMVCLLAEEISKIRSLFEAFLEGKSTVNKNSLRSLRA